MAKKREPKLTLVKGNRTENSDKLTAKQSGFVESLIGQPDKEPCTLIEAYAENYSTENYSRNALYVEASRLYNSPKISLRYQQRLEEEKVKRELRATSRGEKIIYHLEQLAYDNGNTSHTRVKALELLGKLKDTQLFNSAITVEDSRDADQIKEELETKLKSLLGN